MTAEVRGRGEAAVQDGLSPNTPSEKSHEIINAIIRTLNIKFGLPLEERSRKWSPSATRNSATRNSDAEQCYNRIRFLYYQDTNALNRRLHEFEESVATKTSASERLFWLLQVLNDEVDGRRQRLGGRGSREHMSAVQMPSSFVDRLRNEGYQNLPTQSGRRHSGEQLGLDVQSPSAPASIVHRSSRAEAGRRSPNRAVTPTEDDEDFATPPQSPTFNARSVQSKVRSGRVLEQACTHLVGHSVEDAESPSRSKKKRLSDESSDDNLQNAKYARTSAGRLSYNGSNGVSPPRADTRDPLWSKYRSGVPSADTSFSSVAAPFGRSFSTTAENGTSTMHTSFTSMITGAEGSDRPGQPYHSSGTISLDDEILIQAARMYDAPSDANTTEGAYQVNEEPLSQPLNDLSLESHGPEQVHFTAASDINATWTAPLTDGDGAGTSRSPEHHQVRDLPNGGLCMEEFPRSLAAMPFHVRYECARVALHNRISLLDVMSSYRASYSDYDILWKSFRENPRKLKLPPPCSARAWRAASHNFDGVTMRGTITINQSNIGPIFRLNLEPLLTETSCRFQRVFGGDRFLYLEVPYLERKGVPEHLKSQLEHLLKRYLGWLCKEKNFLGRTWSTFHVAPKKRGKGRKERSERVQRVVLFATQGTGLSKRELFSPGNLRRIEASVSDMFKWFLTLEDPLNRAQSYCKAYARLDLGFSQTIPALVFRPSQIRWEPDIVADGSAECSTFDDETLRWPELHNPRKPQVMNDGCSRISVGAARQIWANNGSAGPIPSVFQARIGGCKGLWMCSASTSTKNPDDLGIWIEVTPSQTKFQPCQDDKSDDTYCPDRLTFEVLKFSRTPKPDKLHRSFLPILENRGVPRHVLETLFRENLEFERERLLEAIEDPVRLRKWLNEQNWGSDEWNRDSDVSWVGGLPAKHVEKIIFMLESGFSPLSLHFLARITRTEVSDYLDQLRQRSYVRLAQSTYIMGIADPLGVLQPGEVHLVFSRGFEIEGKGECLTSLDRRDVLVARHPTLRRSDIQKVRAVYKSELSHLVDVVVFPSKGSFPLAGKLQGGDYDGDEFWVCWEPELTAPFRNAPPPVHMQLPESFGIKVDRRTVEEINRGNEALDEFFRASFEFKCRPDILGIATNFHEKLAYAENTVHSPGVNSIADIHDYLVDAAKMGYILDDAGLTKFIHSTIDIKNKNPPDPAFKQDMQRSTKVNSMSTSFQSGSFDSRMFEDYRTGKREPVQINDYVYFKVLVPHTDDTLKKLRTTLKDAPKRDTVLENPYDMQRKSTSDPEVQGELEFLVKSLAELRQNWLQLVAKKIDSPAAHDLRVQQCHESYARIMPRATSNPLINNWTTPFVLGAPTQWECLKASALFSKEGMKFEYMAFHIAGRELGYIKAQSTGRAHTVVHPMWAGMKPRKEKRPARAEQAVPPPAFDLNDLDFSDYGEYPDGNGEDGLEYCTAVEMSSDE